MVKFLIGMVISIGVAYLAIRMNALDNSGGIAAGILGTVVFGLGGLGWAVVLLTFFISSSVLSKLFTPHKRTMEQLFEKGSRRDAWQVAANGGVAGILTLVFVILIKFRPDVTILNILWLGFAASLAGANADTWGTEIGVLNPGQPILLTTFRQVPKGTSGGVSWAGTLAAFGGAALVGGASVLVVQLGIAPQNAIPLWLQLLIVTLGGFAGALVDSFLGATVQGNYYCPLCQKDTERHPLHLCGAVTIFRRGWKWMNNDAVNLACTLSAGVVGLLIAFFL
jgi:uncharacterized protein (TIGR00297 family)